MKILIINTVPTDKNGITNVIFNYLNAIDKEGLYFDYVSLNNPAESYLCAIRKKGGKVYVLPRSKFKLLSYWNRLRRLVKHNVYDLVHIHGNSHTLTLELSAVRMARCVVGVAHAHTTTCKHVVVHKILTPLFNALCTHGLACGEAAGRFMFGKKPFKVMNNGVDTNRFTFDYDKREKVRVELGWINNPIIGHVGYFTEVKNQSFIVDVFELLHKQYPKYRLVLIGDGPLKNEVKKKLALKGLLDDSCLTGNIDNVDEYLNAIDTIVMPSLFEGLPLTLIEQQANGLPCVVADTITKEADKTGNLKFLSLNAPVEEWVDAILKDDGITRAERSKKAITDITTAGYNIKEQARKLTDFYFDAVQKKK